jgi:regulator of cell morphogenesis and NO signaling
MSRFRPDTAIGHIVAEEPSAARLFERLGVDYCCGGDRSLEAACAEEGLDATTVLRMLEADVDPDEVDAASDEATDWTTAPLDDLIDHIEQTHHAYLREELPHLEKLLDKVTRAHAEEAPWLESLREVFSDLKPHMLRHIEKEETIVFPFIRQRLGQEVNDDADPIALGPQPMNMMEMEHDDTGEVLERIRALTDDYTAPDWACDTLRDTLERLHELERDTHQHVHKENNILFSRARALIEA